MIKTTVDSFSDLTENLEDYSEEIIEETIDDDGIPLDPKEIPEEEDCADDTVVLNAQGRKVKVHVPELVSMTDVLFDRCRREFYFCLCENLRNGELNKLTGHRILNKTINSRICRFPHVNYWRIDRENFYADVAVELKLKTSGGYVEWKGYIVCWCSFEDSLAIDILELTSSPVADRDEYDPLTKYLVPVTPNKRVDEIAEEMWREYLPEALTDPSKRKAELLAEKMGLSIQHQPVYEHRGVDSIVFFKEDYLSLGEDRLEKVGEGKKKRVKAKHGNPVIIPANTIVVNSNNIRREYSSFDIFHECFHFENHYLFYRLQELASNDFRQVPTKEILVDKDEIVKDSIYFMEKQADRGGMGLMMPATHTRQLIQDECEKVRGYRHVGYKYDTAGTEMRKQLCLPDFRIRARMVQLGHYEAKGALNYVNGTKIEPFAFDRDAWKESDHTFVLSEREVKGLAARNGEFKALLDSGEYIYADGHVVKNTPAFVRKDEEHDRLLLTERANSRVDACCLRFVKRYEQRSDGRYVYGRMYYDAHYVERTNFYLDDLINKKQMDELDAKMEYKNSFPHTFVDAFDQIMERNGDNRETAARKLNTTTASLGRWLYNPEQKITFDFIVRITLLWEIPEWISKMLIDRAMIRISEYDRRHQALEYIRTVLWDQGIDEANKYLSGKGLDTLPSYDTKVTDTRRRRRKLA